MVPDAVTVGIGVGARVDLVDYCVARPRPLHVLSSTAGLSSRSSGSAAHLAAAPERVSGSERKSPRAPRLPHLQVCVEPGMERNVACMTTTSGPGTTEP